MIDRGLEPDKILSFKRLRAGRGVGVFLQCHKKDQTPHVAQWRTSTHANKDVSSFVPHTAHYEVQKGPVTNAASRPGSRAAATGDTRPSGCRARRTPVPEDACARRRERAAARSGGDGQLPSLKGASRNLAAVSPDVCYRCHEDAYQLQQLRGQHQIGGKSGFNCTTYHDPHGTLTARSKGG